MEPNVTIMPGLSERELKSVYAKSASTLLSIIAIVIGVLWYHPVPAPINPPVNPTPVVVVPPADIPPVDVPATTATLAPQKAKLRLSDGRVASFRIVVVNGVLTATAAVGLDQVLAYTLVPIGEPGPIPPAPPAPVPTPVPDPPAPPAPVPTPPVAKATLSMISATNVNWCEACNWEKANAVPALQSTLGSRFATYDYLSNEAKKLYPESALLPRWVLTRPDGTVEKRTGAVDSDTLLKWVEGKR